MEIGIRYPEDWLGTTDVLGAEIRKILLSPTGEILPPTAQIAYLLEQTTPISDDTGALLKVLCRLAAIQVFLNKATQ